MFTELVQKVKTEDLELSLKCSVISSRQDLDIGSQQPYRVNALPLLDKLQDR
jgi:hypothetical protein